MVKEYEELSITDREGEPVLREVAQWNKIYEEDPDRRWSVIWNPSYTILNMGIYDNLLTAIGRVMTLIFESKQEFQYNTKEGDGEFIIGDLYSLEDDGGFGIKVKKLYSNGREDTTTYYILDSTINSGVY